MIKLSNFAIEIYYYYPLIATAGNMRSNPENFSCYMPLPLYSQASHHHSKIYTNNLCASI